MAERILDALGLHEGELSILLVEDEEIRELNRRYRGKDQPTNVLSFPMGEGGGPYPLLGDVVISTQWAEREAEEQGVGMQEEMAWLLAHGILHLLGYQHEEEGEAERMQREERRLTQVALGQRPL